MGTTILFWINIATSIATLVALIYTIRSFDISQKEFREARRQWNDAHRPHLDFSITCSEGIILLKVYNYGLENAYNISFKFDEFLKTDLMAKQLNDHFKKIEEKKITIGSNQSKYFYIHPSLDEISYVEYKKSQEIFSYEEIVNWFKEKQDQKFRVSCTYTGSNNNDKYTDWAFLAISEYLGDGIEIIDSQIDALLELNSKQSKTNKILESINKIISRR